MDGDAPMNPYLAGNFAPIHSEDDFDLTAEGDLPRELRGALFRIGPNPQFAPRDPNQHWFAGDGMVHGFYVADGKATYRNRYVRTPKWNLEHAAGRSLFGGFNPMLNDPSVMGKDAGVANTNIVWHGGRLMALEEAHMPTEMVPATLDTVGYVQDYRGRTTAHPKIDPVSGEMIWFAYGVGPQPLSAGMSYGVTDRDGRVVRRDDFQAPYTAMVHDFMVTENHVLFPVMPLTASLDRVMQGRPAFAWEPDKRSHVGVMRRDGDVADIRWFNAEACYVFHALNAWEADGKLFCDVMRYDAAPLFPRTDGSPGAAASARLVRWTFDLGEGSDAIQQTPLDDLAGEFPRVDPRVETRKHRHGWYGADTSRSGGTLLNAIAHLDLETGRRQVFDLPGGDATSEPVFVPARGRCAGGRRLGHRRRLPRGREPLGPAGLRGPGDRARTGRHGPRAAPRALRLPR